MKIAMIIVRTLLGLLFLMSSITYMLMAMGVMPMPETPATVKPFMDGLAASGYVLPLLKFVEFICGLMLVTGRFVPLALVMLAPIVINILMVHLLLDRTTLVVALLMTAAMLFLAYCYRDAFKPLLTANYTPSN